MATSSIREDRVERNSGRALERALAAAQTAHENRARDIQILDLRELTTEFDFFVLATGTSVRQMHAISDEIDRKLEVEMHDRRQGIEGYKQAGWVLLDYGDVVIHLFDAETRGFYRLDELWCEAKRIPFAPREAGH